MPSTRWDIWVDFNGISPSHDTTTYADWARPGADLSHLLAGDHEGCTAQGVVIKRRRRWRKPAEITLWLDLSTFAEESSLTG